jgi:hypothetical protein
MTPLLTLPEVAEKLRISAADPARAVKRLIRLHGTPYRRIGAQWLLSEADLNALMGAICFRCENVPAAGMSAAQSGSEKRRRSSPNIARERLSELLRSRTARASKGKPKPSSSTGPRLSVVE